MKKQELRQLIREEIESFDNVEKVTLYLEKELELGNLQKFDIDEDEIYSASSRLGIKLEEGEAEDILFNLEDYNK